MERGGEGSLSTNPSGGDGDACGLEAEVEALKGEAGAAKANTQWSDCKTECMSVKPRSQRGVEKMGPHWGWPKAGKERTHRACLFPFLPPFTAFPHRFSSEVILSKGGSVHLATPVEGGGWRPPRIIKESLANRMHRCAVPQRLFLHGFSLEVSLVLPLMIGIPVAGVGGVERGRGEVVGLKSGKECGG